MANDVSIANRALTKLGASRILLLTDDTEQARVMNSMFVDVRDSELRRHWWNFSIKRDSLPALADKPSWGYEKQYPLPSDYLAMIQVNDQYVRSGSKFKAAWSIEDGKILTDYASPLKIRYVKRQTDAGSFDPLFVEVLACKLALEAAEPLTQSASKKQAAFDEYKFALMEALRQDAIENPPDEMPWGTWLESRDIDGMSGINSGDPWQSYPRGY